MTDLNPVRLRRGHLTCEDWTQVTQCWWLYLLVCRDGRTYAGIATDVAARFAAHSSGKGAKFTRSNPPVRVLGAQSFASRSEALKAEAALKKLDRTAKLAWARKCPPLRLEAPA